MENIPIDLKVYQELLKALPLLFNCHCYQNNELQCVCEFSPTIKHYDFNTLITTQDSPELLKKSLNFYKQKTENNLPISIELYHSIDFPTKLTLAGYTLIRNYITITRSLQNAAPAQLPPEVTFQQATTHEAIKDWLQLHKMYQFFSSEEINHLQQQLNNPTNTMHLFVLYQNSQPANASLAHIQGDNMYMGFNITHHDFRNHGLGKFAMQKRLCFAKEQGCAHVYGLANSSSLPLTLQLEFKPLAMITDYALAKEGD